MKVELTDLQLKLLRDNSDGSDLLSRLIHEGNPSYLEGDEDSLQKVSDLCWHILGGLGFNDRLELTKEGAALEDLVDKLYVP